MAVFFWFWGGKRETVKSVVLLNEIDVLRGGGGVGWSFFQSFWMFLVIWRVLGSFMGIICYGIGIGGFEAGKWEAGGWKMWTQNKMIGGVPWCPVLVLAARGEDIQVGGKQ